MTESSPPVPTLPPLLRKHTMKAYFLTLREERERDIKWVLDYAPTAKTVGLKHAHEMSVIAKKEMDAASASGNYAAADHKKRSFEMWLKQYVFEAKLHKLCNWANRHVDATIDGLKAKRDFQACIEMTALQATATKYLTCVTDEDNAFLVDVQMKEAAAKLGTASKPSPPEMPEGTGPSNSTPPSDGTIVDLADLRTSSSEDEEESSGDDESWDPILDESDDSVDLLSGDEDSDDDMLDLELGEALDLADLLTQEIVYGGGVLSPMDDPVLTEKKKLLTRSQHKASCKRKGNTYTSSAKVKRGPRALAKPPSLSAYRKFIHQKQFKVFTKEKGKKTTTILVDVTKEPFILSIGKLICKACNKGIDWNNRGKHCIAQGHIRRRDHALALSVDLDVSRRRVQQRISAEGLVGRTYSDGKINGNMLWLMAHQRRFHAPYHI